MFVEGSSAPESMAHLPLHPIPPTSSSSELANALNFPPPRIPAVAVEVPITKPPDKPEERVEPQADALNEQTFVENTFQYPSIPDRYCSVKGCKAVIPGSYDYKMCPPCRERYRIYGNTKRAKWKYEREAFEREMSALRVAEDERRKANGLGPLADNIEELRAWELSIINEEVPMSPGVDGPPLGNDGFGSSASDTGGRPPYSAVLAGVHPSSIDSPHATSPYPHSSEPLPARMCTVSHCHKILPGCYRYKRCEQHRLQNRYHSKLKRTREKEEKSMGPEEKMEVLHDSEDSAEIISRQRKPKEGKKAKAPAKTKDSIPPTPETLFVKEYDPIAKEAEAEKKNSKSICGTLECHNLLFPGARWRTCEDCRTMARRLKFQARAEQKATESQYWRSVAEKMSAARKSEENSAVPTASGSGSGHATFNAPSTQSEATSTVDEDRDARADGDTDADADADADAETDPDAIDEALVKALVEHTPASSEPDPAQGQGRQLIWKTAETGRPESPPVWTKGYNKFRVSLPPTPPSPPPARAGEQVMKLDDQLAFKGYKPTTTSSAIGRILARNPNISVDAFSEILEVDGSKPVETAAAPLGKNKVTASMPVATPTIPTSHPFVYKAPEKRNGSGDPTPPPPPPPPAPTASKGKRKATPDERDSASSSKSSSFSPAPQSSMLPPPPSPFMAPYGYPPSYPYYPYYPPQYQIPPYLYENLPPVQHPPVSSSVSTLPSNFFPYPYVQQAYSYPPSMPYMLPRYPEGAPNAQPYPPYPTLSTPAPPPVPYPYYPQPPIATVPAVVPASISAPPTKKSKAVPKAGLASKSHPVRVDIQRDGNFNHYHYGAPGEVQTLAPPEKERAKRRKMDPDYLAKYQSLVAAKLSQSASNNATPSGITVSVVASSAGEHSAATQSAIIQVSENRDLTEMPSTSPATRTCVQKSCRRSIETDTIGNICEKCKLKLKRHQINTRKKFRLEPRKFLLDKDATKITD
ncbi:hypothetical protein BDN70DRAFT_661639 [Pholiota conissans]|uniref:Uncharacterized protein n=1 Tax=Pholiota conissans TaxID=109636 RepID=A0A9P5Z2D6_9AGAR|nr:hypothetical protein BDN70DRAFT_661639 [Pholiota conissans]